MEDNKLFDLVEKMYADLSGKMAKMESRMDSMEANMATKADIVNMATKQDIARLENKMDANHKALYDGYQLTYEKLEVLDDKASKIEEHVAKHDVEIKVIKSVK